MTELFARLSRDSVSRCFLWSHPPSGLRAVAVVDDLRLGPAAGGVRTRRYGSFDEALADAASLARSMTRKCALGGLTAGGCKIVVLEHEGLDRAAAFTQLGRFIEELGGLIRTAGDLGTQLDDLALVSSQTRYVHTNEMALTGSVARGLVGCVRACVTHRGGDDLAGLRVAVQGCGSIGAAVARALRAAGASVCVADSERTRAEDLARDLEGVMVLDPADLLRAEVDLVAPCAVGGVIDDACASSLRAWAVVGAANNILARPEVATTLQRRGILFVPDIIASAGAVIDGVGETVMGLRDRGPLIDRLGETAREVLARAEQTGQSTLEVAIALADEILTATDG